MSTSPKISGARNNKINSQPETIVMNNPRQQENDAVREVLYYIQNDPVVVHSRFFAHRHPQPSAPFHRTMLLDWYSSAPRLQHIVFRGGAKSTTGEEAVTMLACTASAMNIPIIGSSQPRAKERLAAIKHEIENNDYLLKVFGDLRGDTWAETKVVLKNNVCLHALGWDQSMRGIKHLDWRPDFNWIDDIEDEENTQSPEARDKVTRRLVSVVIPAIDAPGARIRITGTPLDPNSLVEKLAKSPDWVTRRFPAKRRHKLTGEWEATWPERKPLSQLDSIERQFIELGELDAFQREYMCTAISEETRRFKSEHMKAAPTPRSYQATYAVYDPARTTNELSAHTGKVVFSWHKNRLIVWESSGNFWKPDEIVNDIFLTDDKYSPVHIGVEEDGLHEFIMQPIRAQSMTRGQPVPIKPLKAPKGKLNFIQGLQPFFVAGEVTFVPDLSSHKQLTEQLISFPSGRIDIPNALAYALKMRPGLPMLDNFQDIHIQDNILQSRNDPYFLTINSTNQHTAAILIQLVRGQYRILRDWLYEGDTGTVIHDIHQAATLEVMCPVKVISPPKHFSNYDTIGLRPAALKAGIKVHKGGDIKKGLEELRALLSATNHGLPSLVVSPSATWTLRACVGGYSRQIDKTGFLQEEPSSGPYLTLMEGLQSVLAFSNLDIDGDINYAHTISGHRYISAKR
jgi:hypothetical protein